MHPYPSLHSKGGGREAGETKPSSTAFNFNKQRPAVLARERGPHSHPSSSKQQQRTPRAEQTGMCSQCSLLSHRLLAGVQEGTGEFSHSPESAVMAPFWALSSMERAWLWTRASVSESGRAHTSNLSAQGIHSGAFQVIPERPVRAKDIISKRKKRKKSKLNPQFPPHHTPLKSLILDTMASTGQKWDPEHREMVSVA